MFRGYLFERLGKLFGPGIAATSTILQSTILQSTIVKSTVVQSTIVKSIIVLVTSVGFGLGHYAVQGMGGTAQATIVGLVFGTIYAVTGRLWMLMCAHAAFDLTALAIIYWNVENEVAHLVFD